MARGATNPFARLAVSLLLLSVIAWGWSYLPHNLHHESHDGRLFLILSEAPISAFDSTSSDFEGYGEMVSYLAGQAPRNRRWQGLGFALFIGEWPRLLPNSGGGALMLQYVALILPYWFVVTVVGLVAALALWRASRRKRSEFHGHCLSCGYDLRFSRDRCPECGSIVPERASDQEAAA